VFHAAWLEQKWLVIDATTLIGGPILLGVRLAAAF
jgi:hypothetical protein